MIPKWNKMHQTWKNKSIELLISQLKSTDQNIYKESVDALLAIARVEPLNEDNIKIISNEINTVANRLYALYETIKILPEDENTFLLNDFLNSEIQNILPTLLKLGVMDKPDTPIEVFTIDGMEILIAWGKTIFIFINVFID